MDKFTAILLLHELNHIQNEILDIRRIVASGQQAEGFIGERLTLLDTRIAEMKIALE